MDDEAAQMINIQAQNTESDPTVESEVGILDDNGSSIVEQQRKEFEKEIDLFSRNIATLQEAKANYQVQWDIEDQIYAIRLEGDNSKAVNPKFKYEQDGRYWKLIKQMTEFQYKQEKHLAENRLLGYDQRMRDTQQQLDSVIAKLNELNAMQKGE